MLQQRRPSPALHRLAEALLPVQPLPLLEQSFALCSSVHCGSWRGRGLRGNAAGSTTSVEPRDIRVKKTDCGLVRLQQRVFALKL